MSDWVVGIDLGGTKIRMGLVSPDDKIVALRQVPTQGHEGPAAVVERMGLLIEELTSDLPPQTTVRAVGICTPGPVDIESGMLLDPPNLQGLHHIPLRRMLSERTGVPVVLEHDAKAAALGDYHFGAGRGARSMVYIVVGTGVGAAMIVQGALFRGDHNAAGEIGHTTIDRNGAVCSCGSRGCVETYMSGPWLPRHYRRLSAAPVPEELSGSDVAHRAAEGDPVAVQVMDGAGCALGTAIATLAMVMDIDLYVIGGSVAKAGDLLLEPARRAAPNHCFASISGRLRIVPTALGDDGPILGCAWLARHTA